MLTTFLFHVGDLIKSSFLPSVTCEAKFRGKVPWRSSLKEALEYADKEYRPVMVIIWMEGCPSCTELIPKLAVSNELAKMVIEDFAAVGLNEHKDDVKQFRVDGGYTPRIYFLSPKGQVDLRFYNKFDGDPEYRFYYPSVDGLLKTMKEVVVAYPDRCTSIKPCTIHGKKK